MEETYAESLKTKKVLLVKSTNEESTADNEKRQMMSKITAPVEQVKTTLICKISIKEKLRKGKSGDSENQQYIGK